MAESLINSISQDEIDWAIQMSIEGGELDYYAGLKTAKREGFQEGQFNIAKTMLSMGYNIETVSEITKLSKKEIETLQM